MEPFPLRLNAQITMVGGESGVKIVDLPASPEVLEVGRQQFMLCAACHGQRGEGFVAGPPLAGSEWVNGPVENLIKIQLRGLQGPIQVKGVDYDFAGGMAPLAYQSDIQIAGVLSYIRTNFGNDSSAVTVEQVAALRGEVGKPQITVEELIKPEAAGKLLSKDSGESLPGLDKYKDLNSSSGIWIWVILGIVAIFILGLKIIAKRKRSTD